MNKDDRSRRNRRASHLSAEDDALWQHVARSVQRPRRIKAHIPELSNGDGGDGTAQLDRQLRETVRGGDQLLDTPDNTGPPRGQAPDSRATQRRREHQIPLADFDRKAVRRIRSGRIEIEARMDLHGMRQDEAYAALRGFLNSCHARGLRWVLIITGKGRVSLDGDRELVTAGHLTAGRGVLRRSVPRWLAEPELRPIIVSYTTAATHHGGEGALYVQLRGRRMAGHPG